ncbi:MAG: alanine racemase [Castellaniella sp.]
MTLATLHIHPAAIAHNLASWKSWLGLLAGRRTLPRLWAVVKSDAYGHGLAGVLPALAQADGLAISSLDEAHTCRARGWTRPLLFLGHGPALAELADPRLAPMHLVVQQPHQVAELEALRNGASPHVWLRHAGRLHHAGLDGDAYHQAYARLLALQREGRIAGLGHMQHYARGEEATALAQEREAFAQCIQAQRIQNLPGPPGPVCSENSAAVLTDPDHALGTAWLRNGIVLYGINPLPGPLPAALDLMPAMSLRAPIVATYALAAGDTIGYEGRFRAARPMRVGLVSCGYADGYPRDIGEGAPCLIQGRPSRVIGRVSMETLSVDLGTHPDAGIGDDVILWGDPRLPVEAVAASAGTNAASLCTGITARVPRRYPGEAGYVALPS